MIDVSLLVFSFSSSEKESMETNQDEANRPEADSSTQVKDKQTLEQEHKEKINKLVN